MQQSWKSSEDVARGLVFLFHFLLLMAAVFAIGGFWWAVFTYCMFVLVAFLIPK